MKFRPGEILFLPTEDCSLSCPHCQTITSKKRLSAVYAKKFMSRCRKIGVDRVGFSGGEPFLALGVMLDIIKDAVRLGFYFDSIMTNGVWYRDSRELKVSLRRLAEAGYDGSICVSVDAFHRQKPEKLARFINAVLSEWKRPDVISIASVVGADDKATRAKLGKLACILKGRLCAFETPHPYIRGRRFFIKIYKISLSPVGTAARLKNPWDGKWFREDHCEGPGNAFIVTPSGDVKPCCGYASHLDQFTIGNVKKDTPRKLLKNFRKKSLLYDIFDSGLSRVRRKIEQAGYVFPGKTTNHCYFCYYLFTEVRKDILERCANS